MEQALINELIQLLCKGGAETFVGNFQRKINEDHQSNHWTQKEIGEAVDYLKYINDYFGKDEAVAIITSLVAQYNINFNDLSLPPASTSEKMGVGEMK
jgi:hypothetical protein